MTIVGRRLGPQAVVSPCPVGDLVSELLDAARLTAVPPPSTTPAVDLARLAAIEDVIRQCEAVQDVVVRSFDDAGSERFVAYFVPDPDAFVTISEVRRFIRATLPTGDAPQQLVEIEDIPRHDDGSPDRGSLRDPLAPEDKYAAPRTTTEKTIARIWRDALGVERVSRTDNFFDLGGHSLLSVRVVAQVSKRLGVRLDQASMALGTLEQVARYVERRVDDGTTGAQS